MRALKRTMTFLTRGSDRPMRRLIGYYAILAAASSVLIYLFPSGERLLLGNVLDSITDTPRLLRDGLIGTGVSAAAIDSLSLLRLAMTTLIILVGTLALMLPVSWVYMSARETPSHNQSVAQTLIILPIVVAGIVLIVRDSLALAFSLAGVVAAVRFRTTLRDARDTVFIFLAIAVGFSAGVQTLGVGALLSLVFNIVTLLTWQYDFGRNVLAPTATAQWADPLNSLAHPGGGKNGNGNGNGRVPDRELVLSLTPAKVDVLAQRFERVRNVLGSKKKPRFNAVLSVATEHVGEAQVLVQNVLDETTKRWMLDEIVTNTGRPSEMYYLVRLGKSMTRDDLITAIRARAGDRIVSVGLELGATLTKDQEGGK
jgi:hypothetical protein